MVLVFVTVKPSTPGAQTLPERRVIDAPVHAGLPLRYSRKWHPVGRALHWPLDDKQSPNMAPYLQAYLRRSRFPGQGASGTDNTHTRQASLPVDDSVPLAFTFPHPAAGAALIRGMKRREPAPFFFAS